MNTIYEKYNLKRVINASGKMTALGVSKYVDEAIQAQQVGGKNFFVMDQLAENVGGYVAKLIGAEDAQIVCAAAAGIAQSVAAVIGRGDEYHLYHPYSEKITRREIVTPKGHNVDFGAPIETMVELGGGKLVEAGYANKCTPQLMEDVITSNTAAILYVKSHHSVQKSMPTVEEAVTVAHRNNLPLIVDAAAEEDLHKYLHLGADLVIYSGAKAIAGPTSGIVLGKEELIKWVRMQSKGIGRAMKIGKENILGLAAAIEAYLEKGTEPSEQMRARLAPFLKELMTVPDVEVSEAQDPAGREIYRARVQVKDSAALSAKEVMTLLEEGDPAIYIRNHQINNGILEFDIRQIDSDEMDIIVERLSSILKQGGKRGQI